MQNVSSNYEMSEVTNLIISFSIIEDEKSRINELNCFFNNGRGFKIISADFEEENDSGIKKSRWYGGSTVLETPLCISAFNHLDLSGLVSFIKELNWAEPENVQIMTKNETSDKFKII